MARFCFYAHVLYFDFFGCAPTTPVCRRAKPLGVRGGVVSSPLDDNGVAEVIHLGVSPSWSEDYCQKQSYYITELFTET